MTQRPSDFERGLEYGYRLGTQQGIISVANGLRVMSEKLVEGTPDEFTKQIAGALLEFAKGLEGTAIALDANDNEESAH